MTTSIKPKFESQGGAATNESPTVTLNAEAASEGIIASTINAPSVFLICCSLGSRPPGSRLMLSVKLGTCAK